MSEDKRIVEINGIKIEVDLRTAKRVDCYKVGDRVKVLTKRYGDAWDVQYGVIVAFDEFVALPSITVCYIDSGYVGDMKFACINSQSKDIEIAPCNDDVLIEKAEILRRFDAQIEAKQAEIRDLQSKRNYFLARFGAWFKPEATQQKGRQA